MEDDDMLMDEEVTNPFPHVSHLGDREIDMELLLPDVLQSLKRSEKL